MASLTHTVGGTDNLVSFQSAARVPIESLKVHFKPTQDLHGYSKPWVGGSGKNLFNINASEQDPSDTTVTNTTVRVFTPGTYTSCASWSNWRDTARILSYSISNNILTVNSTTGYGVGFALAVAAETSYAVSCTITGNGGHVNIAYYDAGGNYLTGASDASDINNTVITTPADATIAVLVFIGSYSNTPVTFSNIQFEKGTAVTSYQPYENVCPIVGWNECEIYKTGYNIFDEEYEDGGLNDSTGSNYPDSSFIRSKNYIPCKPNTSYCFSYTHAEPYSANLRVYYYDINKQHIRNTWITPKQVVTSHSRAYYMRFYMDSAYKRDGLRDVSINYPSIDTQYHAYCGECIPITFPITGKNLFDPNCSMWNHGVYIKNEDEITQTGSDGRGWTDSNFLPMPLSAGTYTITCSDGNVLTIATSIDNYETLTRLANGGGTFTLSEDCNVKIKHSASNYPTSFTVQLEYGNTATAYEPYDSNNTVYGGYVDITKGELVVESIVFKINENTPIVSSGSSHGYKTVYNLPLIGKHKNALGSNLFALRTRNTAMYNYPTTGMLALGPHDGNTNTVEIGAPNSLNNWTQSIWIKWLASNGPIEVCYELLEPICYPLTPIQLTIFLNQNNIWSNTNDVTEVSYAIHDSAPIRAAKQRMAAFNARKMADLKNILRSNYLPNGATWVDEVDIDFDAGDYIEASIDVSGCTGVNENILSIGSIIDTWSVANSPSHVSGTEDIVVHFYYPSTSGGTKLANDLTYTAVADGTETAHTRNLDKITLSDTTFIIKIDKNNVYVNGAGIMVGGLIYTAMTIFQAKTKLLVGSLEGSSRSHATYNYIKVVRGQ